MEAIWVIVVLPVALGLSLAWLARCLDRQRAASGIRYHSLVFLAIYVVVLMWAGHRAHAREPAVSEGTPTPSRGPLGVGEGLGLLGAALATGLSVLGAGYAVAVVGAAALGAITEKPELFGRTLIFVGLAEGLAIYGLIVSILILGRLP